jgi:hypothetical protein
MDLSGLPQFTVAEIRVAAGDPEVTLIGRLSHLRGVRNTTAWLYRSARASMIGTVSQLPISPNELIEYQTSDVGLAPELRVGSVYPWIDGYWQAYQVAMVLAGQWESRRFHSGPARYFRLPGVTGWQPIDAPLMDGAEDLGIRDGEWDHEHCELCGETIGEADVTPAYVDPDDHWLCAKCYDRYGLTRDVSFAAEA